MKDERTLRLEQLSDAKRQLLLQKLKEKRAKEAISILPIPRQERMPLSFAQRRLWLVEQLHPGQAIYNVPFFLRLDGPLRVQELFAALEQIVARHESLRTSFGEERGEPFQRISAAQKLDPHYLDFSESREPEAAGEAWANEEARKPFDLEKGPLFRVTLVKLHASSHLLSLCLHHIVTDGWSRGVLLRELTRLYNGLCEGEARLPCLPSLPIQYADFAHWQHHGLEERQLGKQLAYWKERLHELPTVLDLPADRKRPAQQSFRAASAALLLPESLIADLEALCHEQGATLFMALLAGFQVMLHRLTGLEDLVVGADIANRNRGELEGLIGFFVNMLLMRSELVGNPRFCDYLAQVKEHALDGFANQDLPFERLVEVLAPKRDLSRNPLFQVAFVVQNTPAESLALADLQVKTLAIDHGMTQFDLVLSLNREPSGIQALMGYAQDLFEPETIQLFLDLYRRILEEVAAQPETRIAALCQVEGSWRERLVKGYNRSATRYPDASIPALFAEVAAQNPEREALRFPECSLSYRALDRESNRLAQALRERGAGPEVPVGLYLQRSARSIIAMLAVLKTGGLYVPLDPDFPTERIDFLLRDAGISLLVSEDALMDRLPSFWGALLNLDADAAELRALPGQAAELQLRADSGAYIVYTSGSTGQPKGILIPQRAVVRLVRDSNYLDIQAGERIAQASTTSFDAATFEIWGALLNGACLVGLAKERLLNPKRLAETLAAEQIDNLFLTTALFNQCARECPNAFAGLKRLLFGGEACEPELVARVQAAGPPRELLHVYGPTENTTFSTFHLVGGELFGTTIPIGQPIANSSAYVLDAQLQPVPEGVLGELYLGGDGLARGYLHAPELTARCFLPNPFAADGSRLYRSGDLVRRNAKGAICFVGRRDHQIKFRGFRIELGEIEAALRLLPGVSEAVVLHHKVPQHERLIAFVAGPTTLSGPEIRQRLRQSLPEFMLPARVEHLASMPLTANGKLDRKLLEKRANQASDAPQSEGEAEVQQAVLAPMEALLAEIFAEILGLAKVGRHDDFFDLGGHSLLATRVVSRIRELFQVELALQALFEAPTVAELLTRIEAGSNLPRLPAIEACARVGRLPLSFAQLRLWLVGQLQPLNPLYNVPMALRLNGPLDEQALAQALDALLARHEVLRTHFPAENGTPWQEIAPPSPFPLERLDLSQATDPENAARAEALERAMRPFDLARGPLLRGLLVRTGEARHLLLIVLHHIATDGWSWGLFFRELTQLYRAFHRNEANPLQAQALQYADFAVWQREQLRGETLAELSEYWRKHLEDCPTLALPLDYPRPAEPSHRGAFLISQLEPALAKRLHQLGRQEGVTPFMTLLAAFQLLLGRIAGQDHLIVGADIANRNRAETEQMFGFFINMLAMRADLSGNPSFRTLLARTRVAALGAFAHQDLPFEKLVEALEPERTPGRTPLFQVAFVLQNLEHNRLELEGVEALLEPLDPGTSQFDLVLSVRESAAGLSLVLNYATDLFAPESAKAFLRRYENLLAAIAADPDAKLWSLALDGEPERANLPCLRGLQQPNSGDFLQEIAAVAARQPRVTAVLDALAACDYAALYERALGLAEHLRTFGVGPEVPVGICLNRTSELAVAILAVLEAGGVYVPLDPSLPMERLAFILGDSAAPILLLNQDTSNLVPSGHAHEIYLDEWVFEPRKRESAAPLSGEQAAYLIYTSGSSGTPKAVAVTRRSLGNHARAAREAFQLEASDRVLLFVSPAFDAFGEAFYPALLAGAGLIFHPNPAQVPAKELLAFAEARGVTVLHLSAAYWHSLVDGLSSGELALPSKLRLVVCGGEKLQADKLALWQAHSDLALINAYGPTEATISSSYYRVAGPQRGEIPVGLPLPNLECWVLDPEFGAQVSGGVGELGLAGEGLARGYLNQPALTAAAFVPHPFATRAGERLYLSGDLARIRPDGNLELRGRMDGQLKLNGYRIEPGEIENRLRERPEVAQAHLAIRQDSHARGRLTAYLTPAPGYRLQGWDHKLHRLPDGLRIACVNKGEADLIHKEIFSERCYLRHGIQLAEGDLVLDVGANIGLFTLFVLQQLENVRVFAFEPMPPLFETLRRNLELYGLQAGIFPFGLADKQGEANFTFYPDMTAMSSSFADPERDAATVRAFMSHQDVQLAAYADALIGEKLRTEVYRCPLRTLSQMMRQEGWERIDLLKIDVEKAEWAVLDGIEPHDWARIAQMVVEVHDHEGRLARIQERLQAEGFEVVVDQDADFRGTQLFNLYARHPRRVNRPGRIPLAAQTSHRELSLVRAPELDPALLRLELERSLPAYMVPADFILLEAMPLTANGKLDHKALARIRAVEGGERDALQGPANETEALLAAIWAEVLGRKVTDMRDNFFELGGDSIRSIQALAKGQERGLDFSVHDLFQHPTVETLARKILAGSPSQATFRGSQAFELLRPADRAALPEGLEDAYPLTRLQEGMLFHSRLNPETPVYRIVEVFHLRAPFVLEKLDTVVQALVAHHPILRTRFEFERYSEPLQLVERQLKQPIELEDLREKSAAQQAEAMRALIREQSSARLVLNQTPLLRLVIHRLDETHFQLSFCMHHAMVDGWSVAQLMTELVQAYRASLDGNLPEWQPLKACFRDYVAQERRVLADPAGKQFWLERLEDCQRLDLRGQASPNDEVPRWGMRLSESTTEGLKRLALAASVPLKTVVLTAHLRALALASGKNDVLTGLIGNARPETRDGERIVGLFLNTLPCRIAFEAQSWVEQARAVFNLERAMMAHRAYPLAQIQTDLHQDHLLETAFNYVHFHVYGELDHKQDESEILGTSGFDRTNFTLLVNAKLDHSDASLLLGLNGDPTKIDAAGLARLGALYRALLETMASEPEGSCLWLPEAEVAQGLAALDGGEALEVEDLPLYRQFQRHAARNPEALALMEGEHRLSAAELGWRAHAMALYLRQKGLGPGSLVGLHLERGATAIAAMLAVGELGGYFVALSPELPAQRLAFLMEELKPEAIFSLAAARSALPNAALVLDESDWAQALGACSPGEDGLAELMKRLANEPLRAQKGERILYAITTSGSEGLPKIVLNGERAAGHRFSWMWQSYPFAHTELCCHKTSLGFVDAIWEIFGPLLAGVPLLIPTEEVVRYPQALAEELRRHGVTRLVAVPSLLEELVSGPQLPELRLCISSGESLTPELARRLPKWAPNARFLNLYGSSEVAADVTWLEVDPEAARIAIGKPLPHTRILLLDSLLQPVIPGVGGEIYVAGAQLAFGYANRPDLTAQRFVPNPRPLRPGERIYRTGDLGCLDEEGRLLFLGRADRQLKLRGQRLEPGEIEAVLKQQPGLAEAVVRAVQRHGQTQVVAYLRAQDPQHPPALSQIQAAVRARLPEVMRPSAYQFVSEMPRTPSGKLDRKALPECHSEQEALRLKSGDPLLELLTSIWRNLLGVQALGETSNFFELGGHSLLAGRLINRFARDFGVEYPLRWVFEHPTLGEMARSLNALLQGAEPFEAIPRIERDKSLPLSFAQQRIWFIERLRPGTSVFNIPISLWMRGPLDVAALEASFSALVARHEGLRTGFPLLPGAAQPVQVPQPPRQQRVPVLDFRNEPDPEAAALEHSRQRTTHRFDLSKGSLFVPELLRTDEETHLFVCIIHHIVTDGWSMGIFVKELLEGYRAIRAGQPLQLPELPIQMADYAHWQRQWLSGERRRAQLAYWREQLRDLPPLLTLPSDHPRPALQSFSGARRFIRIPQERAAAISAFANDHQATLFMVLLAALQTLLARYSGMSDIVIGADAAGRSRPESENLIGFFVNMLVMRADLSDDPSFRELLARARKSALEAYAHQDVPFEQLVEELQPQRNLSYSPLFQVALVQLNAPLDVLHMEGLELEPKPIDPKTIQYDLVLSISDTGHGLRGAFMYSTDLFEPETIERLVLHFETLLMAAIQTPDLPVSHLPLLPAATLQAQAASWNPHCEALPSSWTAVSCFAEWVARTPDAEALVFGETRLSYAELDHRANRLAHYLQSWGVGPEVAVGFCLEQSAEAVIAILAILKAGGYYVPLDAAYPLERLAFMIEDAQLAVLLTCDELLERMPSFHGQILTLDGDAELFAQQPEHAPELRLQADHLAYVIYTSGSTGKPKGIQIPHRGLVRLVRETNYVALSPSNRIAQASSLSFDAATFELWGALLNGGCLVGVPKSSLLSASRLALLVEKERIDTLFVTTALFHELARQAPLCLGSLKNLLFGGEAVVPDRVRDLLQVAAPGRLLHVYGPTESTTYASWHLVETVPEHALTVPIGLPLARTSAYVLDQHLQPVAPGLPGELYLGGEGLARGYLGRAELSAERFVPNPFAGLNGEPSGSRLYRTGDRVSRNSAGAILFLGRNDHQIKLRGHRIELGEIEAALLAHPEVREAVALVRDQPKELLAFALLDRDSELSGAELRAYLNKRLPDYMLPAAVHPLHAFPMTAGGKSDRAALAQFRLDASEESSAYRAPSTDAERKLAQIWGAVLGRERVGMRDNFFEIGGDSIRSIQIVALAEEQGLSFAIEHLFRFPTIAELVQVCEVQGQQAEQLYEPFSLVRAADREKLPADLLDAYPLTQLQTGMVYHSELAPDSFVYHDIFSIRVASSYSESAWRTAIAALLARHDGLRTSFALQGLSEPLQLVHREVPLPLETGDLRGLDEAAQKASLAGLIEAERRRHFNWAEAPMLRFFLHPRDEAHFQFTISLHHAILDGWSVSTMLAELFQHYYELLKAGQPLEPRRPGMAYGRFVALERQAIQAPDCRHFWSETLADAGFTRVPRLPRTAESSASSGVSRHGLKLDEQTYAALRQVSQRLGVPLKSALLAVHLRVLRFLCGQNDVVSGYVTNGRPEGTDGEKVLGLFLNTLPFRFRAWKGSWAELVRAVFESERALLAYRRYPLALLQRERGGSPLFETAFNFTHYHVVAGHDAFQAMELVGETAIAETEFTLIASFDVDPIHEQLNLGLVYRNADLDAEQVACYARIYQRAIKLLAFEPDSDQAAARLLDEQDANKMLVEWNQRAEDYPKTCLHERFEARVAEQPDAPALIFGSESLSYAALNAAANRLAHYLRAQGVGPEVRVGLCLERSFEMLIAVYAVLKAGGVYVPIDPGYPAARRAYMLESAGLPFLLTRAGLVPEQTRAIRVLAIDAEAEAIARMPSSNLAPSATAANSIYLIFTSGSTGRPKASGVTHGGFANLVQWYTRTFQMSAETRILLNSSLSFDLTQKNLYAPLILGGALVLVADELYDPDLIRATIEAAGVTVINCTPSAFYPLVQEGDPRATLSLRQVFLGGEPISLTRLRPWLAQAACKAEIINSYGPTECTDVTTYFRMPKAYPSSAQGLPIGFPIANTSHYILDESFQPLPVGSVGELFIGGDGVGTGYLGDPAQTASKFLPDPFRAADAAETRIYGTGDLCRYLPDGSIEFLGRMDHQVKIRGYRLELGEIEAQLERLSAVRQAVVIAREFAGERRLAAYLVAAGEGLALDEVRQKLQLVLPGFMIPAAFCVLEAFPLTPSGKVDRKALPDPDFTATGVERERVAPRTALEALLLKLFAELLEQPELGVCDNLIASGLHSLLMARAVVRIRSELARPLALRTLFDHPTVEELARFVEQSPKVTESAEASQTIQAANAEWAPLSFAQQRLWFVERMTGGSPVYNLPLVVALEGELDLPALHFALDELVRRHHSLRTIFPLRGSEPMQRILPAGPLAVESHQLESLTEAEQEKKRGELLAELAQRPFRLESEPGIRVALLRSGPNRHHLALVFHHIVTDAWSLGLLIDGFNRLYRSRHEGREPELAEPRLQYSDYARIQREQKPEELERQLNYWRRQLAGAPELLELPKDFPRPAIQSHRAGSLRFILPAAQLAQLKSLGREQGATLYMTLLAAFQAFLQRYSGARELCVGSSVANREQDAFKEVVGPFVNMLCLRARFEAPQNFRELLHQTAAQVRDALENADLPFERVVEALQPERAMDRSPLFQAALVLQSAPATLLEPAELVLKAERIETGYAPFDLLLSATERTDGLACQWMYALDLFREETAARMVRHFQTFVARLLADPNRDLAWLALEPPAQFAEQRKAWNATIRAYPDRASLADGFEAQVALRPDAPALDYDGACWSYAALNRRANQIAHHLRSLGLCPGLSVGLYLEQGPQQIAAILGILKAGGCYLPLDPSLPTERLALLLDETAVPVVITAGGLDESLPSFHGQLLDLDLDAAALAAASEANLGLPLCGALSAYQLFTSGSTGQPKGILVSQRAVLRLVMEANYIDFDANRRIAQAANLAFDAATFEIWGALLHGACLVGIPRETLLSPHAFGALLRERAVDTLFLTTALFNECVRRCPDAFNGLRDLLFGGEQVDVESVALLQAAGGPAQLTHVYGPTEATTFASYHPVGRLESAQMELPIGLPLSNSFAYLLDEQGQELPVGLIGEIYLGGDGLADAYAGRPAATAEAFVPDPFSQRPGARLYRTGDLARRDPSGALLFMGRRDHQVKLRGYRIELGEIERRILSHPGVEQAVVILREDGGKRLVAFYLPHSGRELEAQELRQFLRKHLPDYMVPALLVPLQAMPLSATGKVDRRLLHKLRLEAPAMEASEAPRNEAERQLAAIWCEVLQREAVGIQDNFFDVGGDSIRAIQVIAKAGAIGLALSIQQLFSGPTIAELAAGEANPDSEALAPVLAAFALLAEADRAKLGPGIEDAYPMTKLQEGMVFHSEYSPNAMVYHDLFSYRVTGVYDEAAWRAALAELIRRHKLLRTSFQLLDFSVPLQLVHAEVPTPLSVRSLRGLSEAEQAQELQALLAEEQRKHFDWKQAPLLRLHLLPRDEKSYQLIWSFHHAILDGWSLANLFAELFRMYLTLSKGQEVAPFQAPRHSFADYVARERAALGSPEAEAFWTGRVHQLPLVALPQWSVTAPKVDGDLHGTWSTRLKGACYQGLHRLASKVGVSIKHVLLAAHLRLLTLACGGEEAVVGVAANGRLESEGGERMVGLFLNMLPVQLRLPQGSWCDLVRATFEAESELLPHRRFPMAEMQRRHGGLPLFHSLFNFLNYHVLHETDAFEGLRIQPETTITETNYPLAIHFEEHPGAGEIQVTISHLCAELSAEQVAQMGQWLEAILAAMAHESAAPHRLFQPQGLLAPQAHAAPNHRLYDETLLDCFALQLARNPEQAALIGEDECLSYAELERRATNLAARLQALGAGPDVRVGLCFDRSLTTLVAVLAIIKAGAAYVPLDPSFPRERLAYILADSGTKIVVAAPQFLGSFERQDLSLVDPRQGFFENASYRVPKLFPDNLAYVMYTSGSTGQPKGVEITHRNIVHLFRSAEWIQLGAGKRMLHLASLGFDASTLEIWGPLTLGGACVTLSERLPDARAIGRRIREAGVTTLFLTTSFFNHLVIDDLEMLQGLEEIFIGGEALSVRHIRKAVAGLKGTRLLNGYGPTEATTFVSVHPIGAELAGEPRSIPLGKGLPDTELQILDGMLQPVPLGAIGELYIGGDALARGYLNRAALTAAAFVPNPFASDGSRLYRSGDRVRRLADGTLEYLGRDDRQVKVRGFRIELDEISSALVSLAGVIEAVSLIGRDGDGRKRIDAYLVAAPGEAPALESLREQLGEKLPAYMIPARFLLIDAIPLTPNGKTDEAALSEQAQDLLQREPYQAPRTETERRLALIWSEVLARERVGIQDDFIALGGHSLLATQVVSRIRREFSLADFPLRTIFEAPTILRLAALIDEHRESGQQDKITNLLDLVAALSEEEAQAYLDALTKEGLNGENDPPTFHESEI